jgi:hypothetical protein
LGKAAHCGSLTCLNVTTFKLSIAEDEVNVELPQVVRDIVAVEKDGKTYVKFCASTYGIEIACASIVVSTVNE